MSGKDKDNGKWDMVKRRKETSVFSTSSFDASTTQPPILCQASAFLSS